MRRVPPAALVLAALLATVTAVRLPAAWSSGNALNHVSGAWMTLADDLAHGTFYRPLGDGLTTGGTRFFPLAFALHAGLLRLGGPLLGSGYALSLAAALLLVLALSACLRAAGLGRGAAAGLAVLALAGLAGQHALTAVRGDLLAVALQATGLAAVLAARPAAEGGAPAPPRRALSAGALLLGLAFAAKPTALTAAAAAAVFLAVVGRPRRALALAAGVIALGVAVVLATEALSGGRFLVLLRACAAGGAGPDDLLRAPLRLARRLGAEDPAGAALVAAAALAAAATAPRTRAGWREPGAAGLLLALLWLVAAGGGALVVFASPGTGVNHLLELEASAALTLGAALARLDPAARLARPRLARAASLAAVAAALLAVLLAGGLWRADLSGGRLADLRATLHATPAAAILAEDPLVPLLAGERPAVLDPWMLRLAAARDPGLTEPLVAALRRGDFAAVVLLRDLADPAAEDWYAGANLGPAVAGAIRERYRRTARHGRYVIYAPAPPPPLTPGTPRLRLAGPIVPSAPPAPRRRPSL
jgi:hypothetical protein